MDLGKSPTFDNIFKAFGLTEFYDVSPLGQGHINETYLLDPGNGDPKYVLQKINKDVFGDPHHLMENIQTIRSHVAIKGYCTPDELKLLDYLSTTEGEFLYEDHKSFWRINHFLANTYTVEYITEPHQAFDAAYAYGRFIWNLRELASNKIYHAIPDFHNAGMRMKKFEEAIKQDKMQRVRLVANEIAFINEHQNLVSQLDQLTSLGNIHERITHNDTKINNVLFNRATGKIVSVIDLDTVMPGYIIHDFGDMIRTFTPSADEEEVDISKVSMRMEIFRALSYGFLEATDQFITKSEKENLVFGGLVITFEQALRFLTDFIEGDPYYSRISRPNQNLDRTKNQLALLSSIIDQKEEMQKLIDNWSPRQTL